MIYYSDRMRHLICEPYSIENLHKMADDLGINRRWFHNNRNPHYDIPKKRMADIQAKTTVITPKELLLKIKAAQGT